MVQKGFDRPPKMVLRVKKYAPMGPAIIAKVKPKSLNMTALDKVDDVSRTYSTPSKYVSSGRRSTYVGTAGVMIDASDALGLLIFSSLLSRW